MRYRSLSTLLALSTLAASASPLSLAPRQDTLLAPRTPLSSPLRPAPRQPARRQEHLEETAEPGEESGGNAFGSATSSADGGGEEEDDEDERPVPVVGAPHGDFYLSTDKVQCEDLRITLGGGNGPPYSIAIVNADTVFPNSTLDEVQVLQRVGVMGMPGITFTRLEALDPGTAVALQVVDAAGRAGYSVARRVQTGHLNEYCHYPGQFWPPSRWDGTHYLFLLAFLLLLVPLSTYLSSSLRQRFQAAKKSFWASRAASAEARRAAARDIPLQESHVLGDEDDDSDEDSRPLLYADGTRGALPDTAPPVYDEAVKEESLREGQGEVRDERRSRTVDLV